MIEASALNMLLTHMLVVRASQYRNGAEVRDNMPYVMQQFQLK